MPYPPAYTEIYPVVTEANIANNDQMGWRQPDQMPSTNDNTPIMSQPTQPPPYGTQQQANQPGKI